jgi:hypothetical protein
MGFAAVPRRAAPIPVDPVATAQRSASALKKGTAGTVPIAARSTAFGACSASSQTLTKNTVRLPDSQVTFEKLALVTALQVAA